MIKNIDKITKIIFAPYELLFDITSGMEVGI